MNAIGLSASVIFSINVAENSHRSLLLDHSATGEMDYQKLAFNDGVPLRSDTRLGRLNRLHNYKSIIRLHFSIDTYSSAPTLLRAVMVPDHVLRHFSDAAKQERPDTR